MNKYLSLAVLTFTAAAATGIETLAPNQVCVYREENFQGLRKCFRVQGDLCDAKYGGCHGPWNDKIKSIQFGSNVIDVKLFRDADYAHEYTVLTSGTMCLDAAYQDFTSLTIRRGILRPNYVCLYREENFQGPRQCFPASSKGDLCDEEYGGCFGPWNDKIKSIQFGSNVGQIKLFQHQNYDQEYTVLTSETTSLDVHFRDFTSFYVAKAVKPDEACIYKEPSYLGKRKCFPSGAGAELRSTGWNNQVESIQLGSQVSSVDLFLSGQCQDLSATITSSQEHLLDSNISSLYVKAS